MLLTLKDKIKDGYYTNKFPYVTFHEYSEENNKALKKFKDEEKRILKEFETDALKEVGLDPKLDHHTFEYIFDKYNEKGFEAVLQELYDIAYVIEMRKED